MNRRWPGARRVRVVCGRGNNGGDGFVLAGLARRAGLSVDLRLVGDPASIEGDAALALAFARESGLALRPWQASSSAVDVTVDALLGTGIDRPVSGRHADAIAAMNGGGAPILALDLPSGLNASTGAGGAYVVRAATTITFIGCKAGLLTGMGPECAGEIEFANLDIPMRCYAAVDALATRVDHGAVIGRLGRRGRTNHKGHFGHVLVVGGAPGFAGAARLAAEAAARVGAGLTSVATHPEHAALIANSRPELMCHGVETGGSMADLLAAASVIVVGPGLGQDAWARSLFSAVRESPKPMVIDADGLNLLGADPDCSANRVLTPHPGEAARLLGGTTAAIAADRFAACREISSRYGGVALLKGAGTVIHDARGTALPRVVSGGNPGMASGGMGDVLSGVIAGLLAQIGTDGGGLLSAAVIGACVHAEAADRSAALDGERGLLAGDLMMHLRRAVNGLF